MFLIASIYRWIRGGSSDKALTPRFRVFAAAAFLLLAPPVTGAEPGPGSSGTLDAAGPHDPANEATARALVEAGRFAEALELVRPLTETGTVDANLVFLRGVAALEASRRSGVSAEERDALLDEAVESFHGMLIVRPELVRVRLELARAFFFQRKDSLARENFERVLGGDVPPPVAANVRGFLLKIRARRRWRTYFGTAIAPDSNIGGGSEEEFIEIIGLPFRRNAEDLPTSGVGLSTWFGGEYQRPLGDRVRLRLGGDVSRKDYAGSEFDQTNLAVHAGPRWLAGPRTDMSLLGSMRRSLLEQSDDYDELGFRAEAARRLTRRLSGNARISWHDRRYRTSRTLDGPVRTLSIGANWVAAPTVRMNASVGYAAEHPGQVRRRNASRSLRVGAQWALPRGFSLGSSAQVRWTDYEGAWPPFTPRGERREDRTRSLSASVHHRRFTLYGFSPKLTVTNEARSTNAQAHDYRRTRAEVRFVRQF